MDKPTSQIEWLPPQTNVDYAEATAFMEQRAADIRAGIKPQTVWLLEHPPLYTAGTSANHSDLLDASRFPVFESGRGGQFTYHGPGQRIAYVMLDLKRHSPFSHNPSQPDLRAFITFLESWLIRVLGHFGLKGRTYTDRVGVWVSVPSGGEAKIAAIGIRVRKWVTFHGIALNINPDLSHYAGIVPCGIREHGVTSLHALGIDVSSDEIDRLLRQEFEALYAMAAA